MSNVSLGRVDHVAVLTIDRAAKLNSLDAETLIALRGAILELRAAPPRVLLLETAGDRVFVAGADIEAMSTMGVVEARRFSALGHETFDALEALPCLTLAVVQGPALGGGCELALACDLVIAADRARFGQPETNLGIIPGFGGCARLLRRVGVGIARDLIYTGRLVPADEALQIGLVQRVVPAGELRSAARAWAAELCTRPPLALAHAKAAMAAAESSDARSAARVELEAFAALFGTSDAREGLSAFREKRSPTFQGE